MEGMGRAAGIGGTTEGCLATPVTSDPRPSLSLALRGRPGPACRLQPSGSGGAVPATGQGQSNRESEPCQA